MPRQKKQSAKKLTPSETSWKPPPFRREQPQGVKLGAQGVSEKTVSVGGAPVTVTMCDDGVRVWCGSDGETHDPGTGPVVVVMRNKRLGGWNVNVRPADHTSAGRVKIHVSDSDDLDPVVTLAGVRATYSELYDDEADIWDSDQCAEADDSQSVTP